MLRQEVDLDGAGGPESVQIPVFDALGNLTELRREDGVLIERYEYTPFGDRSVYLETSLPCLGIPTSLAKNQIGFHGLLEDPETGLLYARNRYYDPDMGRFVTTDPLGSVDGPNRYQFVGNDPVNGRDPLGLAAMQVSARGGSRDLSGPEHYRAFLAEGFSFEAAESLVVASGLGAEIGADRVRAIAPGIAKAGPALRESLITAYVTGIGTPVVGLTATAAGFSWVGVSLVEGAASGVLVVGSSDFYHGQLSSADDYAMAALIGGGGGIALRGTGLVFKRVDNWWAGRASVASRSQAPVHCDAYGCELLDDAIRFERGAARTEDVGAEAEARAFATMLRGMLPRQDLPAAVSAVVDRESGRIFLAYSGLPYPREIHALLRGRIPSPSLTRVPPTHCAEFQACNAALLGGSAFENLEIFTLRPRTGDPLNRCPNCRITTRGANVLSDGN